MKFQCPIFQTLSFAQRGKISIAPLIAFLFRQCCPFNITSFVVSIYINTFQRMFRRGFASHTFQKFFIRLETELNTTTAVVMKCLGAWRVTSSFCRFISIVFRGTSRSGMSRFSVSSVGIKNSFYATARTHFRMLQRCIRFDAPFTTGASTQPHSLTLPPTSINAQKRINQKFSKFTSCGINHFGIRIFRQFKKYNVFQIHNWYYNREVGVSQ